MAVGSGIGTACLAGSSLASGDNGPTHATLTTDTPTVETQSGRVQGFRRNGIHSFRGLPYAATTAGGARFRPPARHPGWGGVRSTLAYGPVCPQAPRWRNDQLAFVMDWNEGYPGEDCLHLNIWTPSLAGGGRRPVMVWLHGGGFYAGSSYELPSYHGENLSRRGDVVVVGVNHRVGALGYLNLAQQDDLAQAGNVGMLDLVAALEWIRSNIQAFGGDPDNVTLFGQSSGGWKINTLMVMPAARGLFHKAIVQSGSRLKLGETADTAALADATLGALGLDKADLAKLQDVPAVQLVEAGTRARNELAAARSVPSSTINWQPTIDGDDIVDHPFGPAAPAWAARIPMIVGTTMHERSPSLTEPALEEMALEDVAARLQPQLGERTAQVLDAYRAAHQSAKPVELMALILSPRTDAITQAKRQSQAGAPVHLYWFGWRTPVLDGRPRAFHCADLPFVFDNTDLANTATGGGEASKALAARMADAWVAFARQGDPNHAGLPNWPRFEPDAGPVMIFDDQCRAADDPDRRERQVLEAALKRRSGG
jgi:para-nitrobenzyl esterase